MMGQLVLAVDIGGTKTAAALADRDDRLQHTSTAVTPAMSGPSAVIATVVALARELTDLAGVKRLAAVGIGTAGIVDVSSGVIVSATDTFACWPGTPVADLVRAGLGNILEPGAPVVVQNDVDAHALGEFRHGAAAGASDALVVAVGTGIGAGLLLGGRQVRGRHHVAGEIAHMPVPGAQHLRCPCGRMGHLEAIGSGAGIRRHYLSLGGEPVSADSHAIVEMAAAGDKTAIRALRDSADAVGRALAAAASLLDPERIVVTGGVPEIGDSWWQPMLDGFRAEAIDVLQDLPVLPGALRGEAPLRGAAASAWEAVRHPARAEHPISVQEST